MYKSYYIHIKIDKHYYLYESQYEMGCSLSWNINTAIDTKSHTFLLTSVDCLPLSHINIHNIDYYKHTISHSGQDEQYQFQLTLRDATPSQEDSTFFS